jgi:hypothetical protein
LTLREFALRISHTNSASGDKIALVRHDIDSDLKTARAMFDLERALAIRSSYYFRLNTVDVRFMRELEAVGSEAGYHYEEIATFAKSMGIRTREGISARMNDIQHLFQANLAWLRKVTELPIRTVASHGDFANRALQMSNTELLDASLRRNCSIDAEAYDEVLHRHFSVRVSDAPPPVWWNPCDPRPHISNGAQIVHVLVHPSQWRADVFANGSQFCRRCIEGVSYWAKSRHLSSSPSVECRPAAQNSKDECRA